MTVFGSVVLLPNRIEGFLSVLSSLQESPLDVIHIHICRYYRRLQTPFPPMELVRLYQFLSTYPVKTRVHMHDKDVGPCMKVSCMLDILQDDSDILFIFDDDTSMTTRCVSNLIDHHHLSNDNGTRMMIVGNLGVNPPNFIHCESITMPVEVRVLGGYRGVCFPGSVLRHYKIEFEKFFQELLDYYEATLQSIPLHDDHAISSFFRKNGVHLYVTPCSSMTKGKECLHDNMNFCILENTNGIFRDPSTNAQLTLLETFLVERGYEFN